MATIPGVAGEAGPGYRRFTLPDQAHQTLCAVQLHDLTIGDFLSRGL